MLILDAHLEAVLPINLGEVVGHLKGLADFVRGQEVVASQAGQVVDVVIRQAAVFGNLRYVQDSVFRGNPHLRTDRPKAGGVKVGQAGTHLVDGLRREDMRPSGHALY